MHTIDFFHHFFGEIEHVVGTCDLFDAISVSNGRTQREDEFDFSLETFRFFVSLLHGEFATDPFYIQGTMVQCGDP